MNDTIIVTGGAGFIGSNFVLSWIAKMNSPVVNLDALTYAGNRRNLVSLDQDSRHVLVKGDICDEATVAALFKDHRPRAIVHFAAESHVDRSISGPGAFVQTNVFGTFSLLQAAKAYWNTLEGEDKARFRFLHVSTDEVYGTLGPDDPAFSETTPYAPNSPYAASKASSDHFVRAYFHTYGLPVLTTNCSNNYGPYQFPEKLIPLMILNALEGKPLPVYGDGSNQRDWIFVEDHAEALVEVVSRGTVGETYAIGARQPRSNLDVVKAICAALDSRVPHADGPRERLIKFVTDRPGHDFRYEIDPTRSEAALAWRAPHDFDRGLARTIDWYLANRPWWEGVRAGRYAGERLGSKSAAE
jgi:dTDP-glucose 4,6-dehydratase